MIMGGEEGGLIYLKQAIWRNMAKPSWLIATTSGAINIIGLFHDESKKGGAGELEPAAAVLMEDCMVCLCEVSPGDEHRSFPNCNHGPRFHSSCIDSWLEEHSTCPMCRSYIPRSLLQRLRAYCLRVQDGVFCYLNTVLEDVAVSIGECHL